MTGLIYKNFRINLSSFMFSMITTLICCLIAIAAAIFGGKDLIAENEGALMYVVLYYFVFVMPALTSGFIFEAEENKTASAFAMSQPQCAKGHIEAKYWYILIHYLIVLFITFMTDTITYGILGGAFSAALLLVFILCWRLLLSAIEIPFIIRFGSQNGLTIKSMVITFIVFLVLIYFMFGDISWLTGSDDPLTSLTEWLTSGKILLPLSFFPFISCAAYWLSCIISVRLFRKGAENYEQ